MAPRLPQGLPDSRSNPRFNRLQVLDRKGKAAQVKWDTAALCTARLADLAATHGTGSRVDRHVAATMAEIMSDSPERLGSVCLSLLASLSTLADVRPGGFPALVDHMIQVADSE